MGNRFKPIDIKPEDNSGTVLVFDQSERLQPRRRLSHPIIERNPWKERLIKCFHAILYITLLSLTVYFFMLSTYYANLCINVPAKLDITSENSRNINLNSIYKLKAKNMTRDFLTKLNSDKWEYYKTYKSNDSAFIYPADRLNAYKINGTIKGPPDKIAEILFQNYEEIPKYENNFKNVSLLKTIDAFTKIIRLESFKNGPISPREIIVLFHLGALENKNGYFFIMESIDWNNEQNEFNEGFVRAYYAPCGWIFYKKHNFEQLSIYQYISDANEKMPLIPFRDLLILGVANRHVNNIRRFISDKL